MKQLFQTSFDCSDGVIRVYSVEIKQLYYHYTTGRNKTTPI